MNLMEWFAKNEAEYEQIPEHVREDAEAYLGFYEKAELRGEK